MRSTDVADVAIIGAGIVGLATARALVRSRPDLRVTVVDKESAPAAHQTGHNSGVIHSGLYYRPGSLKARMTVEGARALEALAADYGIPYERCGKVVVATRQRELTMLDTLHERGSRNGVESRRISASELREREPHCAGIAALHVPSTGIIDYVAVCEVLRHIVEDAHGDVIFGAKVTGVQRTPTEIVISAGDAEIRCRRLVNCAGLQSDRVARLTGAKPGVQIVPFRGDYFEVIPERCSLVQNLIYPVPDPSFPFLGVHFTRMIGGGLECGPNAVLASGREAYAPGQMDMHDVVEVLRYPGFRRLARTYWRVGLGEVIRARSKWAFVRALQRLVPDIRATDLTKAPAGIRAQALRADGALVDDFVISSDAAVVNVLNAPSPAATACLPIGEHIASVVINGLD